MKRDVLDHALEARVAPLGESSDPPAALRDLIAAGLRATPSRPAWARALPALALAAAVVAAAAWLMPRGDLSQQPALRMGVAVVAWVLGVVTGLATLYAPGRYGLGLSAQARLAWLAASLLAFECVALWSTVSVEGSRVPVEGEGLRLGLGCVLEATLPALMVGALVVRGARGIAVASPWSAALVAGAASGFVGTLVQQWVCPVATHAHTMTAHAAPVLLGALTALWLGRRRLGG